MKYILYVRYLVEKYKYHTSVLVFYKLEGKEKGVQVFGFVLRAEIASFISGCYI
jgi:hypothetical protein